VIAKIANDSLRLDQKKPIQMTHKFEQSLDVATDQLRLQSVNYKDKLRREQVRPNYYSYFEIRN
jgi:hypothetical protein